jgi:hypothetical protein
MCDTAYRVLPSVFLREQWRAPCSIECMVTRIVQLVDGEELISSDVDSRWSTSVLEDPRRRGLERRERLDATPDQPIGIQRQPRDRR